MTSSRFRVFTLLTVFAAFPAFAADQQKAPTPMISKDLQAIAPAIEDYSDRFLVGRLWENRSLTPRDRSLVTISAIVATAQAAAMPEQFGLALDNGVKASEISEMVLHLSLYTGLPNASAAAVEIRKVFEGRGIDPAEMAPVSSTLLPLNKPAEATRVERIAKSLGPTFQELQDYTTDVLFRDLWLRPALAPRDRSLVTISALVATGRSAQLASHINLGMDNGLTETEIAGAITQLAFYSGWPNAMSAATVAKETFAKRPG